MLTSFHFSFRCFSISYDSDEPHQKLELYWIRSDSDNKSMEKHLYMGRVKGGGVFNPLLIPEVKLW
jgi:hypothetical protein